MLTKKTDADTQIETDTQTHTTYVHAHTPQGRQQEQGSGVLTEEQAHGKPIGEGSRWLGTREGPTDPPCGPAATPLMDGETAQITYSWTSHAHPHTAAKGHNALLGPLLAVTIYVLI